MVDQRSQPELDQRWDMHTERQISASKGGITAVTVLNSGSWLALLTQADKLAALNDGTGEVASVVLCWGLGAFFGTLTWLFVYLSTLAQGQHDFSRDRRRYVIALEVTRGLGLICVIAALGLFVGGVFALSRLMA